MIKIPILFVKKKPLLLSPAGKCSNANCAVRTGLAHMRSRDPLNFNPDLILITSGDSDNKFHPKYLEALTYKFLTSEDRNSCIYQVRISLPLLNCGKLIVKQVKNHAKGPLAVQLGLGRLHLRDEGDCIVEVVSHDGSPHTHEYQHHVRIFLCCISGNLG